jgi:hypothetical protein
MLVGITAGGETLCQFITATDRSTTGVFRDGIEEAVDLKGHIARNAHADAAIFDDSRRDVMISKLEEFLEASKMVDEPAVPLMNH